MQATQTTKQPRTRSGLAGRHAIVIGSGITGLAAARVLSDRGARVTVLERDAEPPAGDPHTAFASWRRKGAPQVRHSHAFLGRLRSLLRDHYPDLFADLLAHGARELDMMERPPKTLPPLGRQSGDEDLVALGCRRTTFEWVVRRSVLARDGVLFIPGATVDGLHGDGSPPLVRGVRCRVDGEARDIAADLIVDASGRQSKAPEWLRALTATAVEEESEPSGIIYYTRFYRLRDGAQEPPQGDHPTAADFNWVKYAVFPADERTFSVTLAIPLAEPRLKVLAKPGAFDAMVASLPGVVPWVDPAIAEPITETEHAVQSMGGLVNRLRRFVVGGDPIALGFFALGDSSFCTNPLYGRGCAQAFLHAHLLGECLDAHGDDLRAVALDLDAKGRALIEPFYRASVIADKDAVRKAEGRRSRHLSNRLRQRFFEDGVAVAMRCDPVVFRAFVRMFNMLETPEEAFGKPDVFFRSLWVLLRGKRRNRAYALPDPPDRETTIARCEAAAA